jgi:hypothetical protein
MVMPVRMAVRMPMIVLMIAPMIVRMIMPMIMPVAATPVPVAGTRHAEVVWHCCPASL